MTRSSRFEHDPSQYTGYVDLPKALPDGRHFLIVRGTNFGELRCKIKAFDPITRGRFRGVEIQRYLVTEQEGRALHSERKCAS